MQFGFYLLVVVAVLATSYEAASASTDAAAAFSKNTVMDPVDGVSVHGDRFLRARKTEYIDGDNEESDEERANVLYEKVANVLASLAKGKAASTEKKAATDLTRTFVSPPTADKVTRSKSFSSPNAAAKTLTRSKSLPDTNVFGVADVKTMSKTALNKDFKKLDQSGRTPDGMVRFFDLDTKVLANSNKKQLREAAKGDMDKLGQQELWYMYSAYYKKQHPEWVSELVRAQ